MSSALTRHGGRKRPSQRLRVHNRRLSEVEGPLIMELPPWRRPQLKNVLKKTIVRLREFLLKGTPLVLLGVLIVNLLYYTGLIGALAELLEPVV